MHYAYLDESGMLGKVTKGGRYFIVCVVVVGSSSDIKNIISISRRKASGRYKYHSEFHSHKEGEGFIKLVLSELARQNIDIVACVFDKRGSVVSSHIDHNEIYRRLVAKTVLETSKIYPKLDLVLHRRYTNPSLQEKLSSAVSKQLSRGFVAISQLPTNQRSGLELADAVAWAFHQKYNKGRKQFWEIIKMRVKKESKLAA